MSTNHTPGHQSGHLVGCDDLRTWLQSQGFTCDRQPVPDRDNLANWYAFRVWDSPSAPQHTLQVVQVRPFKLQLGPRQLEMADVAVVREVAGVAYELKAYSLGIDVLREKLDVIAQQLVQACWLIESSSRPAEHSVPLTLTEGDRVTRSMGASVQHGQGMSDLRTTTQAMAEPVQEPVARSLTEDERAAIEYFALNPSMAVLAFSHWLRRDKSAPLQRPAEPVQDPPEAMTERDHFDFARWHFRLGELADAYYAAGRTHPARSRSRADLMMHALDAATGWRARSALAAQEPVAFGALAKRRVFDYIRGAYDLGYNDARNARTFPGDGAPGYKGREVETDHGNALLRDLEAVTARPQPAEPAATMTENCSATGKLRPLNSAPAEA